MLGSVPLMLAKDRTHADLRPAVAGEQSITRLVWYPFTARDGTQGALMPLSP